ncbi:hypothetical protein E4U42_005863 [Claviceps africana]|uniref:Uncharacterized protein n=1 Tax=Claviceps africana TaxID=83212 RepID=A0A8K0J3Q3_9HYPO|nr:hypothetical protein E4U42_005863 [Claviceps africana]
MTVKNAGRIHKMIRPTLPRASMLAARPVDHGSEHPQRLKAFVRHVDKNNNVFYTLVKKGLGRDTNPGKDYAFFQMPDLLLDLDAEGARCVRPVDDADQAALMTAKWSKVPRREAVEARLKELEAQLTESRGKAHAILTQPTNIWRITPHDVVSAALHGASASQRTTAHSWRLLEQATDASSRNTEAPRSDRSEFIDKIRAENGIPPHAADDDRLLLHWMMLRYKSLQQHLSSNMTKKHGALPSPAMAEALEAQSSVTGIRRLVFQHLAAGSHASGSQYAVKLDARLRQDIRDACERVLGESATMGAGLPVEILTFLGNLSERQVASGGAHLGPLLCGLALKLAARIGSLEAISTWLYRCYQGNHEMLKLLSREERRLFLKDVLSTLDSLQSILKSDDVSSKMHDVRQRQLLFQLLTGVDENNTLTPDSIRSSIKGICLDEYKTAHASELRQKLHVGYLTTLGRLGAVRTIWAEWRHLLRSGVARSTKLSPGEDDGVVRAFATALQMASHAMPASHGQDPAGASLEECVTADYHAIEMQELHFWRGDISDDDVGQHIPDAAVFRSILDLPLQECIARIRSWR